MAAKRPNILVIQADQLAPQALPVYGHPLVEAPNIQALADRGGGLRERLLQFPPLRSVALFDVDGAAHQRHRGVGQRDRAAVGNADDGALPRRSGVPHHPLRQDALHRPGPAPRLQGTADHGHLSVELRLDSGLANEPEYRPTGISLLPVVQSGRCVRSLQIDYDDEVEYFGLQKIHDLARYSRDDPFFLVISFTHPHSPFITTDRHWDLYDHDAIDMPDVPAIPVDDLDEHEPLALLRARHPPAHRYRRARTDGPPRLLRHDLLYRRQGRPDHGRDAGDRPRRRHGGHIHQRPWRNARRAGHVVQADLPSNGPSGCR